MNARTIGYQFKQQFGFVGTDGIYPNSSIISTLKIDSIIVVMNDEIQQRLKWIKLYQELTQEIESQILTLWKSRNLGAKRI